MKILNHIAATAMCSMALWGCTNLDETLYDQVGTQNYYNTKNDVIRAVFRPFEHAFWSIQSRHVLNELSVLCDNGNKYVGILLQNRTLSENNNIEIINNGITTIKPQ